MTSSSTSPPNNRLRAWHEAAKSVRKLAGEFDEAWERHRSEPQEIRAVDADRVLLISVERFKGRDAIELEAPFAAVFTLRDGKIARWQAFWDRQKALEAAGLSE